MESPLIRSKSPGGHQRRVAVLMGGQSGEHEISRKSGETVALHLSSRYLVKPILIDTEGLWEVPAGDLGNPISREASQWFSGTRLTLEEALAVLRAEGVDVVFIALHGPMGEDGTVQGLFEIAGLSYTGPEVTAAAVTMDKRLTKEILRAASIPTPRSFVVGPEVRGDQDSVDWDLVMELGFQNFPLPWVVKPNRLGSSVGVAIIRTRDEFLLLAAGAEPYLPWISPKGYREQGGELLVEEFISGRELSCGVVALEGEPRALPPIEIRPVTSPFFDYQAKYTPGATEEICPAEIPEETTREVQELSVRVHQTFRCDPLSRTDFILDPSGLLYVLEINSIPGMTSNSLIPLSAGKAGIELGELFEGMVEHAVRRSGRRKLTLK